MTGAQLLADQTPVPSSTTNRSSLVEKSIQTVRESPLHSFLLEVWKSDIKAFEMKRSDVVDDLRRLRSELYQIISMSLIFEGVVLTAVAQTTKLNCCLWWSPVVLSISVAIFSIVGVGAKHRVIRDTEEERDLVDRNICTTIEAIQKLYLSTESGESNSIEFIRPTNIKKREWRREHPKSLSLTVFAILVLILLFSIIVAIFSKITLCHHCSTTTPPPPPPPSPHFWPPHHLIPWP